MTGEEVIQILEHNPNKYLKKLLIYRNENNFDMATLYIQNELKCDKEAAQQGAFYIFDLFSNIKPHQSNNVKCPYCQSTDTKKISGTSRFMSTGIFGLASKKIGKQWHCNKCKSDF